MRTFFRRYFTHNRYVSATATPVDALQLDAGAPAPGGGLPLAALHLDLRPFINRSPFTVRKDCSSARAHQASARRAGGGRGRAGRGRPAAHSGALLWAVPPRAVGACSSRR